MSNEYHMYLGDGVYVELELELGRIILKTMRETGEHFIYLEPGEFYALIKFATRIRWLEKGQLLS